jgi:NAD(P)-dependent dehydrogenase (short-subunit alcohol dehydrogenase family)
VKDRVALVTGAGSERGIGRHAAVALARHGAKVAVTDVDAEGARRIAASLEDHGFRALGLGMDVTSRASVHAAVAEVSARLGEISILVNNAGISLKNLVVDIPEAEWDRVLAINLKGAFLCTQAVLPVMIRAGYGRIVSVASVAGKRGGGVFGGAHYCASKAGLLGFSKTVAREVADRGITVNCVVPGMIDTDIFGAANAAVRQRVVEGVPVGRPGRPEEVAAAIAFLASSEAAYVTGEEIDVNGGFHMD